MTTVKNSTNPAENQQSTERKVVITAILLNCMAMSVQQLEDFLVEIRSMEAAA